MISGEIGRDVLPGTIWNRKGKERACWGFITPFHVCALIALRYIIFDINGHVRPLVTSPKKFYDLFITRMTSDWEVMA